MKKTILTLALVGLSAAATYAQGTIQFANSTLSKVKYVDTVGAAAVDAPVGCVYGVFWGATADSLHQEGNGVVSTVAGVFSGGTAFPLVGSNPGETVSLKIAGWLNKGGQTPLVAPTDKMTGLSHFGESQVVTTGVLGPSTGPGTVIWQGPTGTNPNRAKPFEIAPVVPEPSVIALGALGLGALLLRRRKA